MRDLEEFLDPTLRVPIKGKTYVIQSPDSELGLRLQQLWTIGSQAASGMPTSAAALKSLELSDDDERDMIVRLLGDTYAEMVADCLPWEWIRHVGVTMIFWVAVSREAAEAYWESPGETQPAQTPESKEPASEPAGSTSQPEQQADSSSPPSAETTGTSSKPTSTSSTASTATTEPS